MPNVPSVYTRFMWYVRLLTYNGFVVLIDNHLNSDGTITRDQGLWVQVRPCSCEPRGEATGWACQTLNPQFLTFRYMQAVCMRLVF